MKNPIDIIPIHLECNECFEDQFLSVVSWWNDTIPDDNFIYLASESWYFTYDDSPDNHLLTLGDRLYSGNTDTNDLLKKYYGIGLSSHTEKSFDAFIQSAKNELLLGKPVLVNVNSFYVPWDYWYKRNVDYAHTFIITGIDENNKIIMATDGYYKVQNATIGYDDLEKGFQGTYITFDFLKAASEPSSDKPNWKNCLRNTLENVYNSSTGRNSFSKMRLFADRFTALTDIKTEIQNDSGNFIASRLYTSLTDLVNGRKKYSMFIRYLYKKHNIEELEGISAALDLSATKWYNIQLVMVKASMLTDFSSIKNGISKRICEVADYEENIAEKIKELIDRDIVSTMDSRNNKSICEKFDFINMEDYFTNRAFGTYDICCTAGYTKEGQYFLIENLPANPIWEVEDMKFKFPKISENLTNNLICSGQRMEIAAQKYNCLMLLGSAEWGNFSDELKIIYKDGSFQNIIISFSDWYNKPYFDEAIAWKGKVVEDRKNGIIKIADRLFNIYAKKYFFNESGKDISGIILPECENIHIYAMTLAIAV